MPESGQALVASIATRQAPCPPRSSQLLEDTMHIPDVIAVDRWLLRGEPDDGRTGRNGL
jgi:hypothetical protein